MSERDTRALKVVLLIVVAVVVLWAVSASVISYQERQSATTELLDQR